MTRRSKRSSWDAYAIAVLFVVLILMATAMDIQPEDMGWPQ